MPIKKFVSRFPHALRGLVHALKNDFGFRTQIYLGLALILVVNIFLSPIGQTELLFLLLAYLLVLITELQNSALESALDRLHPEKHLSIKHAKDMAAGAVLVAGVFLLIVILSILF